MHHSLPPNKRVISNALIHIPCMTVHVYLIYTYTKNRYTYDHGKYTNMVIYIPTAPLQLMCALMKCVKDHIPTHYYPKYLSIIKCVFT
jgi:hypothetical protein